MGPLGTRQPVGHRSVGSTFFALIAALFVLMLAASTRASAEASEARCEGRSPATIQCQDNFVSLSSCVRASIEAASYAGILEVNVYSRNAYRRTHCLGFTSALVCSVDYDGDFARGELVVLDVLAPGVGSWEVVASPCP